MGDATHRCEMSQDQLAAAREEVRIMTNHCAQLRQELAAERKLRREEREVAARELQHRADRIKAERLKPKDDAELLKPLVDALNWLKKWLNRQGDFNLAIREIDTALARVKGGK